VNGLPALPWLVLITDWSHPRAHLERVLGEVLPLGPRIAVQHRHPGVGGREFAEEARWLCALCAPHKNPLFVNERLDVAILLGAHLHLPSHGPGVSDVRPRLKDGCVSVAVHDEEEAARGKEADFALVSPVFKPSSKPDDTRAPLGWPGFQRIAQALRCPAFALGGVDQYRLRGTIPAAVSGLGVMGGLWNTSSPRRTAEALLGLEAERRRVG
jgi:thiamine-phosphate pyrophosphorylase